jgi:hypothetical protein
MPVYSTCPTCTTGYNLDDSLRGKRVICQTCNGTFLVQETLAATAMAGAAAPIPPAPPQYDLIPPQVPPPVPSMPHPAQPAPTAYAQPPDHEDWDRPVRRRRSRGPAHGSGGLSAGAIVAIVVTPIAVLMVGLIIWWAVAASRAASDPWLDDDDFAQPQNGPVVVPPARFNNPPPPVRFNNPPPVRINNPPPVRFNNPPPVRINPPPFRPR